MLDVYLGNLLRDVSSGEADAVRTLPNPNSNPCTFILALTTCASSHLERVRTVGRDGRLGPHPGLCLTQARQRAESLTLSLALTLTLTQARQRAVGVQIGIACSLLILASWYARWRVRKVTHRSCHRPSHVRVKWPCQPLALTAHPPARPRPRPGHQRSQPRASQRPQRPQLRRIAAALCCGSCRLSDRQARHGR